MISHFKFTLPHPPAPSPSGEEEKGVRCLVNSPGLALKFGSGALPWGSYYLIPL